MDELIAVIEGVLFASGDPVPAGKLAEITGIDKKDIRKLLDKMIEASKAPDKGILIRELDGKYQMCTKPEHSFYISKVSEQRQKQGLSQPAYETLAIIAYNSPITKSGIEQIRGVNSDSCVETLLQRNLIQEAGRLNVPGRPILFEITDEFLRSFGLNSKDELPPI